MVKVSIIVPVYNAQKYLKHCIDSLINQTYEDWEALLIDDGSTDNSSAICNDYANNDNRIRVIQQNNGGVSSARNSGIRLAKGQYLMFVDSDDYLAPDMVEVLVSSIEKNNADLVVCGFTVFSNNNYMDIMYERAFYNNKHEVGAFFSLLNGRTNAPWNKLYKKKFSKQIFR